MTNIYDFSSPEKRSVEASDWIARLDRGLSVDEADTMKSWMALHPDNATALLELARLWDRMECLDRLVGPSPARERLSLAARTAFKLTASFLIAFLLGLMVTSSLRSPEEPVAAVRAAAPALQQMFETAVGEQSTVNLSDGSQVTLNTNSSVAVRYTSLHRMVTLERGELRIKVAHDRSRPFSVIAGNNIIQAVGTEFNVQIEANDRIELVVTEGRVVVGVLRAPAYRLRNLEPTVLPLSSRMVSAGEELVLGSDDEHVIEVSPVDLEVKLSWRSGNLIFRGESLEDALTEIERYTLIEFVFLDEGLRKVRITGRFKAGDVDGLLAALRENFDIAYQRTEDGTVLLSQN